MGHLFDNPILPQEEQPQEPEKPEPKRGTQEWARALLADIYKRVDAAGSNVSSIRFREKLRGDIREMLQNQMGILTIEKYVDNKIHEHELGSIR